MNARRAGRVPPRVDIIGRYQVVRPLGHGGMGQVFLAHDPTLERDVALKLLHRDDSQSALHDEAKALAALSHPGIVTIFEIGVHEGQDFIAMEYLPGRTLRRVLDDAKAAPGTAPREQRVAILRQVAAAVAAAHRAGILHRDIKPENVVVTDDGNVKVVDFGIARRLGGVARPLTRAATARELVDALRRTLPPELVMGGTDTEVSAGTETMFGTPAYMAPEVLVGQEPSEASDVYSLGVVLFECLAGHRPHEGTTLVEMIAQVIDSDAPPLADPLGPLVERMLARDPRQRPTLDEIGAALEPSPIVVHVPIPPPPRKRGLLWFAIGLVAAGGLAFGGWQLRHREPPPPPPAPVANAAASIAVAPFTIDVPSYGREPPHDKFVADTLVGLLDEVEGAHIKALHADGRATAQRSGAEYLVTGAIKEAQGQLHATVEVVSVATGSRVKLVELAKPSVQFAKLMDALAGEIARSVAPGATLAETRNPARAVAFYDQGKAIVDTGRFTDARPYFEQAVDADPQSFDAWYELALVLSWMDADPDLVLAATAQALATAPAGPKHELMRGAALFLHDDYAGARAVLEPLDIPGTPDQREVLYYLGESNWHDGRHDAAFGYFKRALEADARFRPATVHPMQYALARRMGKEAQYFVGLAGESSEWIEMSLGHYQALLYSSSSLQRLWAALILEKPIAPDLATAYLGDDLRGRSLRIARELAAGDREGARREFAALWTSLVAGRTAEQLADVYYGVELLGETVISAGLTDETRQLVTLLAERSKRRPVRGYHRFAMLAAALLGDEGLLVTTPTTERNQRLGDASRAELAGDHAKAAAILT